MTVLRKALICKLVVCCMAAAELSHAQGLRPLHARKAMVVSIHPAASQVGVDILRQGGNAVDAAVATGFALAVVHPAAGNIGGGGFMLLRKANGELHFLDFREKARKAATHDMYLDAQGNVIPDSPKDNALYKGAMAQEMAAEIQRGGGLITAEDLAEYEVKERRPIRGTYRGYEVISAPPPSSGGITLMETLNILEGYNLAKMGSRSADSMHVTVEAFRRAFFDRAELLGDSDFSQIPVAQLIDKKYAEGWRQSLDTMRATDSQDVHRPSGFGELDRPASLHPPFTGRESNNTTHFSVVDEQGNAVAVTTTLNDSFGAAVTAGKLGFFLNDEMDDFTSKPGVPNGYGLIQGEANAIAPGKRPLSAMAPTIVLKDGKLFMVLGSPGGPRIISTVANILIRVIDYGLDIQQAVNAPRFHHQWQPDEIDMEKTGISPDTIKLLQARGHKVKDQGYWSDGECIAVDLKTGELLGAPDGRNGGKAVGF